MPTIITKGTLSAQPLGFITNGGNVPTVNIYWISYSDVVLAGNEATVLFDNGDNVVLNFDANYATTIMCLEKNTGNVIWQNETGNNPFFGQRYYADVDSSGNTYSLYRTDTPSNFSGVTKFTTSGSQVWQKGQAESYDGAYLTHYNILTTSTGNVVLSVGVDRTTSFEPGWAILSSSTGAVSASYFYNVAASHYVTPWGMGKNPTNALVQIFEEAPYTNSYKGTLAVKFDATGAIDWSYLLNHDGSENHSFGGIRSCAIDSTGKSYWSYVNGTSFPFDQGATIIKLDTNGSPLFSLVFDTGNTNTNIALDANNNLYVVDDIGTVYAFDSTGAQIWQNLLVDSGYSWTPMSIGVDESSQSLVILGFLDAGAMIAKLPLDGSGTGGSYNINGYDFTYSPSSETVTVGTPTITAYTLTSSATVYTNTNGSDLSNTTSYSSTVTLL